MNVEIGAEAALFSEKEYINGIAVAVWWQWVPSCSFWQPESPRSQLLVVFPLGELLRMVEWIMY